MIPQKLLRLVQELLFMFQARAFVPLPQLAQHFLSGLLTHGFVHSGHGNTHFWRNDLFYQLSRPASGNKTFVSIRIIVDFRVFKDK
jgi:hypothetical protein